MVDWSRGQEGRFGQATAEGKQEQSKADAGSPSSWDVTTVERSGQGSAEYGAGGVSCGDPPGTSGAFVFPTAKRFRSSRDFWSSGSSWTGALPRATLLRPFQGLSVRQGSALSRGRWTCPNTVRRRNWRSEKLPSLNTWIRYLSQCGGERGLFLLRRTVLFLAPCRLIVSNPHRGASLPGLIQGEAEKPIRDVHTRFSEGLQSVGDGRDDSEPVTSQDQTDGADARDPQPGRLTACGMVVEHRLPTRMTEGHGDALTTRTERPLQFSFQLLGG